MFKTLLVAAGLIVGASAWAASALTSSLEVPGYKTAHFFDFVNRNYDGTSYTSNADLNDLGVTAQITIQEDYAANTWYYYNGLRNQASGGRWIQFTVDIKADDYIIINGATASEAYEITMTDGTSTTVTNATDYLCFKANKDMSALKLTVHRYNYISQILIMTKDETVSTADYTINYLYNGTIISTTTGTDALGTVVNAQSAVWADGVKYLLDDEQTTSMTIASGTNTLNVNVSVAPLYSYTVNATDGENTLKELATGSVYAGESATVAYPQYILSGTNLYNIANNGTGDYYRYSITPTKDGDIFTKKYTSAVENVIFYADAEEISGTSSATNTARASLGKMGYTANSNTYINVTTLAVGKYKIYMRGVNGNSATRTANYKVGNRIVYTYSIANGTNQLGNSEAFTVAEDNAELLFACDGSSASGTDWFYVQYTGAPTDAELAEAAIADAKADLQLTINEAKAIDTTDKIGAEDLATAITTAETALAAEDATVESLSAAEIALEEAVATFEDVNTTKFYLVGTMNGWGASSEYLLTLNEGANTEEYAITLSMDAGAEFKVIGVLGETTTWYPSDNNYTVSTAGRYNVYFRPNYDGDDSWHSNCIYVESEPYYTVAGSSDILFGTAWDVSNTSNDMVKNLDGTYSITYTNIALSGNVSYKVVKDHAWDNAWPASDRVIGISMAGNYDLTINFNPTTGEVSETMAIYKSITDAGYATYCSNYDLNFEGTGVTAYIAKVEGKTVSFEEVKNAPANTGLLLKADEGTYKLAMEVSSTDVEGNKLVGVLKDTKVAAGSFVLLNDTEGVGFYKTKNEFTVGANTAYLPETTSARSFIGFSDNTTTAVEQLNAETVRSNEVYNLNGQRVVAPVKGLYIVNGKKVVLK